MAHFIKSVIQLLTSLFLTFVLLINFISINFITFQEYINKLSKKNRTVISKQKKLLYVDRWISYISIKIDFYFSLLLVNSKSNSSHSEWVQGEFHDIVMCIDQ